MIASKQSSKSQKQKQSLNNIKQLRDYFRLEAEKAIQQIKDNEMLSLEEIKEGERLFDNIDDANEYLKAKNQQKKKKGDRTKSKSNKNKQEAPIQKARKKLKNSKKFQKAGNGEGSSIRNSLAGRQYMVLNFDENRKWNEKLQNPKTGKFEPNQKRVLAQSLSQYLLKSNIELDDFIEIFKKQKNIEESLPSDLKMWTIVCSVLPDRPLRSSYRFLMRMLNKKSNKGKWTEEQQQQLLSLHNRMGNKWIQISKIMGRNAESIRDKFRTLQRNTEDSHKIWKIEQLVILFRCIEEQSEMQFIKQGIDSLVEQADSHNSRQQRDKLDKKYNSKYILSHNIVRIMQYIDSDIFCKVDRKILKWKQISQKITTKNESDCKNKYLQFMTIYNRDYQGTSQAKVLKFISDQANRCNLPNFGQEVISWHRWNETQNQLPVEQAKFKWVMAKKQVKSKHEKSFLQILNEAIKINERKLQKTQKKESIRNHRIEKMSRMIEEEKQRVYKNGRSQQREQHEINEEEDKSKKVERDKIQRKSKKRDEYQKEGDKTKALKKMGKKKLIKKPMKTSHEDKKLKFRGMEKKVKSPLDFMNKK